MSITDDLYSKNVYAELHQKDNSVTLTFTCADEYEAMLLMDKIYHSAETSGGFSFVLNGLKK